MKQLQDAYVVAATRTPIGRSHRGFFRNTRPDDLLATTLRAALEPLEGIARRVEESQRLFSDYEVQSSTLASRRSALIARQSDVETRLERLAGDREAVEAGARAAGVPFEGLWLDAPADTLVTRVSHRVADVSDADDDVVRRQLAADPGPVTWRRLAAGGAPHEVLDDAVALLRTSTCGASLA